MVLLKNFIDCCRFYSTQKTLSQPWTGNVAMRSSPPVVPQKSSKRNLISNDMERIVVKTQAKLANPPDNDIVELWKARRHKDKQGYYGLGTDIKKPQAKAFDRLIAKSLEKAGPVHSKKAPPEKSNEVQPIKDSDPPGYAILNRLRLKGVIEDMPILTEALNMKKVMEWVHCPHKYAGEYPFSLRKKPIPLKTKPRRSPKKFYGVKCGLPTNNFALYEWMKHKMNKAKSHRRTRQQKDGAFIEDESRGEQADAELEKMERLVELMKQVNMDITGSFLEDPECEERKPAEPKNYDELYKRLVPCFEFSSEERDRNKNQNKIDKLELDGEPSDDKSLEGDEKPRRKNRKYSKCRKCRKSRKSRKSRKLRIKSKHPSLTNDLIEGSRTTTSPVTEPIGSVIETGPPKKKKRKRRKAKRKGQPAKECPCEVCEFMQKRKKEPDSPLILQLLKEKKRRELLEYCKRKRYLQSIKDKSRELCAPQHKCDPIVADDSFCAKTAVYCDYLKALADLKKLVGSDKTIISKISCLQGRANQRLAECFS